MEQPEIQNWLESLRNYKPEEFLRAAERLRDNPPEGWSGMPNQATYIRTMKELRAEDFAEAERQTSQKFQEEMRDLQRRKDAGEKFYGWADLLQWGKENLGIDVLEKTKMPEAPKPEPITEDDWEAGRKRREQLLADFRRANPDTKI